MRVTMRLRLGASVGVRVHLEASVRVRARVRLRLGASVRARVHLEVDDHRGVPEDARLEELYATVGQACSALGVGCKL